MSNHPLFSSPVAVPSTGAPVEVETERTTAMEPRPPGPLAEARSDSARVLTLFEEAFRAGGSTPEALGKLMELHEKMEAKSARAQFFDALATFQREHGTIRANRTAKIATSGGGGFDVRYASLPHMVREWQEPLAALGFSFTWDSMVNEAGSLMTETFVLRHVAGHVERSSFTCPTSSRSGSSDQMKYGAASSYAKRRSMLAGLGVVTEEDAGGEVAEKERDGEKISAEQAANIRAMRDELTEAQRKRFDTAWPEIPAIPASKYRRVVDGLEKARRAQGAKP